MKFCSLVENILYFFDVNPLKHPGLSALSTLSLRSGAGLEALANTPACHGNTRDNKV